MLGELGGMGGRNPWGLEPWDYVLYAVFSALVYALVGWRWWLVPIFVGGLLLWPWAVRLLRAAWRGARVGARTSGAARKPGALYCAECGGELAPATAGRDFAVSECASCGGKWSGAAELSAGLAKKGRPAADWGARADLETKETRACPKCAKVLPAGSFRAGRGVSFRCAGCDGYWFDRIDWVSFELG